MNRSPHECTIAVAGLATLAGEQLTRQRRQPLPRSNCPPAALATRQADEQSLAALAAIKEAFAKTGRSFTDFADWAVVSAPRFPGRGGMNVAIERFHANGPTAISPMVIPAMSLHSQSATVSLVYGLKGPSFGIGGGPGHVAEGILAALALRAEPKLAPGAWLTLTACDPEPGPDGKNAVAHGVALALGEIGEMASFQLRVRPEVQAPEGRATLLDLMSFLRGDDEDSWVCPLPGHGVLELRRSSAQAYRQAG